MSDSDEISDSDRAFTRRVDRASSGQKCKKGVKRHWLTDGSGIERGVSRERKTGKEASKETEKLAEKTIQGK